MTPQRIDAPSSASTAPNAFRLGHSARSLEDLLPRAETSHVRSCLCGLVPPPHLDGRVLAKAVSPAVAQAVGVFRGGGRRWHRPRAGLPSSRDRAGSRSLIATIEFALTVILSWILHWIDNSAKPLGSMLQGLLDAAEPRGRMLQRMREAARRLDRILPGMRDLATPVCTMFPGLFHAANGRGRIAKDPRMAATRGGRVAKDVRKAAMHRGRVQTGLWNAAEWRGRV